MHFNFVSKGLTLKLLTIYIWGGGGGIGNFGGVELAPPKEPEFVFGSVLPWVWLSLAMAQPCHSSQTSYTLYMQVT